MPGQGRTTLAITELLQKEGWVIVYRCIPNTPHIGVVPIPTLDGSSEQRYPDIVAYRGDITRLVEVEISLNERVVTDIRTRFGEMVQALRNESTWRSWRTHVQALTGHELPHLFLPRCDLVICNGLGARHEQWIKALLLSGIWVSSADRYDP